MSDPIKTRLIEIFIHPLKFSKERFGDDSLPLTERSTYRRLAKEALLEAFPPIGYNVSSNSLIVDSAEKYNGDIEPPWETDSPHRWASPSGTPRANKTVNPTLDYSWAFFLSSFFGLPNRPDKNGKITLKQMAKNSIGGLDWKPSTSTSKKILQVLGLIFGIKSILIPAFNLVSAIIKTVFNILIIFTEFLPALIASSTALAMGKLISPLETKLSPGKRILYWTGILILGIPHYLFRIFTLVGRAFSSPRKSLEIAWASGRYLAGDNQALGYVIGGIFSVLSLASSIATWAVLLPFTIHLIPAAVYNFVAPVLAPVYAVFKPALVAVGNFLGPVFSPILGRIGATIGIQISANLASIGVGLATLTTPLVTAASTLYQEASNRWVSSWREGGLLQKIFAGPDKFWFSLKIKFNSQALQASTPKLILDSASTTRVSTEGSSPFSSDAEGLSDGNSPAERHTSYSGSEHTRDRSKPGLFTPPPQGENSPQEGPNCARRLSFTNDDE